MVCPQCFKKARKREGKAADQLASRYAVDATKVRALGWRPGWTFDAALAATVEWYQANRWWWEPLRVDSARVVARDLETPDAD